MNLVDRRNKKSSRKIFPRALSVVVRLTGLEPVAYGLEVRCSIQLSYRRKHGGLISNRPGCVHIKNKTAAYFFLIDIYLLLVYHAKNANQTVRNNCRENYEQKKIQI